MLLWKVLPTAWISWTALACQETGEVWPILRKKDLSVDRILELCVGDTLDSRSAFPRMAAG